MNNDFEEYEDFEEIEENDYNREKTLAILTGLLCLCVCGAGTILGSYHAILAIGVFAGILATCCYVIGDLVVIWASWIDYKEDGNAMEWSSWGVKYIISFYLLFSGGGVAYLLFTGGDLENSRNATVKRAEDTFKNCLKSGARQSICQKQYDAIAKSEIAVRAESSPKVEWLEKFLAFPLFNYIPGILGLFGALILTFVAKVIAPKKPKRKVEQPQPIPQTRTARKTFLASHAPLRVSSAHTVDNGAGFYLSLSPQGEGVSIRFRERGSTAKHVIRVPNSVLQSEQLETMNYKQLALWTLRYMQSEGKDDREICKKIQDTL